MAIKKNTKKKATKSRKASGKKVTATKERAKKRTTSKKSAKKSATAKKPVMKSKSSKMTGRKTTRASTNRSEDRIEREAAYPRLRRRSHSGDESGDLQGLSNVEAADSESVDELLEEGNAFEADVVAGVQSADDADEQEVHTHEVPEDDVPGEYLDEE
jgi:hypothetical protein